MQTHLFVIFFMASLVMSDSFPNTTGPEQCRLNSRAVNLTTVSARGIPNYDGSMASVYAIWSHLYSRFSSFGDPTASNVFMGFVASDDAIIFYQCSATPIQCEGRYVGFAATIASQRIFGDKKLRYYEYNPIEPAKSRLFKTGDPFSPSSRPWWNTTGWAAPYVFFADKTLGQSWILRSSANLRIGADRRYSELCGGCIDEARAKRAVWDIFTLKDSKIRSATGAVTTMEQVAQIGKELQSSMNRDFLLAVYVGYSNDEYYSIADCRTYENGKDGTICPGDGQDYVIGIRNEALLKHRKREIFRWDGETIGDQITISATEYFPTQRPWYLVQNGWTDQYTYVVPAGNVPGRSYVQSFRSASGWAGVISADFLPRESCQTSDPLRCKSYSYAESAVEEALLSEDITAKDAAFESTEEVATIVRAIIASTNSTYASEGFAGWANGEVIIVHDCWNQISYEATTEWCEDAGDRYLIFVGSESLHGDKMSHIYVYDGESDDLGEDKYSTGKDLVSTERPWYAVGDGWTDEYLFVSGAVGISFVSSWDSGLTGVVGFDSVDEDCYSTGDQSREPPSEGLSPGAIAGIVIGSVAAAALILIAIAVFASGAGGGGSGGGDYAGF